MTTISAIKKQVEPIAREHGIKKVYLFGSYAKGNQNDESDIDLLIENEQSMSLLGLSSFMQAVREALQLPVDVVTMGGITEDFRECIAGSEVLIYEE